MLQLEGIDDSARIEKAYWTTLTRTPESQEVSEMLDYIAEYPVRDNAADKRLERWQSLCRLLLGSNEFNYVN